MTPKIFLLNILVVSCCFSIAFCDEKLLHPSEDLTLTNKEAIKNNTQLTTNQQVDVNGTIEEVERILSTDPNLPRLTRDEIVYLLDNITKTDSLKTSNQVDKHTIDNEVEHVPIHKEKNNKITEDSSLSNTRENHQRAIMYVMPYSPTNYSSEDIQELFTKPPIVQIVENNTQGIDYKKLVASTKSSNVMVIDPVLNRIRQQPIRNNIANNKVIEESTTRKSVRVTTNQLDRRNTSRPLKIKTSSADKKFSATKKGNIELKSVENLNYPAEFIEKIKNGTLSTTTTVRPYRGTVRYPNHKYPEENNMKNNQESNQAIKLISPPTLKLDQKLSKPFGNDYWTEAPKVQPSLSYKIPEPTRPFLKPSPFKVQQQSSVYRTSTVEPEKIQAPIGNFVKTISITTDTPLDEFELDLLDDPKENVPKFVPTIPTSKPIYKKPEEIEFGVPDNLKDLIKDIDFDSAETQNKNTKYSSHYTESNKPVQNVQDMLASIGLFQQKPITTTTAKPDWSDAAEGLDPEMKELLMTFGLIPNPNEDQKSSASETKYDVEEFNKPSISSQSYTSFKPLPDTAPSREDMQSFLSVFGLTDSGARSQKSINVDGKKASDSARMLHLSEVPPIETEMIPEDMRDVLVDIGLVNSPQVHSGRMISSSGSNTLKTQEKSHVFNPDSASTTVEELKKLELLLSTIKQLDKLNGSVSQSDLDSLDIDHIKILTESLNNTTKKNMRLDEQENDQLSPLSLSELNNIFTIKKDTKRQNSNDSTSSSASESVLSSSTTTEESRKPSVADLADSFGVNTDVSSQDVPDEALPEPRRTGLYFLVDWNSFLEVGDDEKTKVNIRLSPRVGDPSRFINVKVP